MNRISKNEYYINIALQVSKRSTCLRRQYGCVIVKHDEIIATGYNGAARNETNCCDKYATCPRMHKSHNSGDYSDCPAVHAEQNAMLSAARKDMIGATMYLAGTECISDKNGNTITVPMTECKPCPICERMIKNAGIESVIGPQNI